MDNNPKKKDIKNEIDVTIKNFLNNTDVVILRILVIAIVCVGLYFLMSPYENCKRTGWSARYCLSKTSW